MIEVVIISPFRFQESVNAALRGCDFGCTFRTFTYDKLTDIDSICDVCRDHCSVILFTGELGYHYMKSHYPKFPVPVEFTIYGIADVMSVLLSFHIRHPEIALNRVYLDFLTPMNNYLNIRDYLPPEYLPRFFEEETYDYSTITAEALRLRTSGQIDYVISRSINNLQAWQQMGIPYEAVYPTEVMIRKSIEEAVNRERLKQFEDYSVVTCIVHLPESEGSTREDMDYRIATTYKFLVDLRRNSGKEFSIQQGFDRFLCKSTVSNDLAQKLELKSLVHLFRDQLDFEFSLGFGIHANEQKSQFHAERALLESNRSGKREGYLVSGEPEIITGPLSSSVTVRYSYNDTNIAALARKTGVNDSSIVRLISLYRDNPGVILTAANLEPLLGITLRSTRRILQKLCDLGIIVPVDGTPEGGRGRPVNHYIFSPTVLEKALNEEA